MTNVLSPIVSVLMTVYNRQAFLAQAIESVLASTLGDFELIVVDDGSTDNSMEIALNYAEKDARVRALRNEKNLGDYPNRNRAASYARGKYIKYLDSDDIIYPWGLQAMVWSMERYPEAALGLSEMAEAQRPHPVVLSSNEALLEHFIRRDLLGRAPGSAIIKRSAFESLGGFAETRFVGDTELWLRLVKRFPLVTMPRDLVWDRTHGQQEKVYEQQYDTQLVRFRMMLDAIDDPSAPLTTDQRQLARDSFLRRRQSATQTVATVRRWIQKFR